MVKRYIGRSLVSSKNNPSSSKNNPQHIQLSDTTGTPNGTGFYGQMKQNKKAFLAANTQDGFGEHRDKKYPMCTMKLYNGVNGLTKMSEVNRRGEAPSWSWESKGSGVILDEGMVSDLLSGVL